MRSKILILQDFLLSIFELLHIGFYVHTVNIQTQIACFAAHAKLTIYRLHFPILFSGENIIIIYKLKKYGDFLNCESSPVLLLLVSLANNLFSLVWKCPLIKPNSTVRKGT